ncbi:MAG: IclR family transcriptional regulator [Sphingobium sp.]|nr:IclR family transcriptional regulator [Sphingobium sp.]
MTDIPRGAADRVAYLLKHVAYGPNRFSLSDLAERVGLPASTVHRLLKVLVDAGFVERGPGVGYRIGRELHRLASQLLSQFDLKRSARPFLLELVRAWQETAVLCVFSPSRRRAVIADVVATPHPLRFAVELGLEIALPWGSLGRAILAHLSPGEVEAILREGTIGPLTGRPRPSKQEIDRELALIRQNGFARYFDPAIDIAGVAAPIFGPEHELLGCIGITMPSKRYQLHVEDDLAAAIRSASVELSELAAISFAG